MIFLATILLVSIFNTSFQSNLTHEVTTTIKVTTQSHMKRNVDIYGHNTDYSQDHPDILKVVQYAPIFKSLITPIVKVKSSTIQPTNDILSKTKKVDENHTESTTTENSKKLEPRFPSDNKCSNDLTTAKRSPGHNAIYRTEPPIILEDSSEPKEELPVPTVVKSNPSKPALLKVRNVKYGIKIYQYKKRGYQAIRIIRSFPNHARDIAFLP